MLLYSLDVSPLLGSQKLCLSAQPQPGHNSRIGGHTIASDPTAMTPYRFDILTAVVGADDVSELDRLAIGCKVGGDTSTCDSDSSFLGWRDRSHA